MARPLAWGDTRLDVLLVDAVPMTAINLLLNLTASDTITTMRIIGKLKLILADIDTNITTQVQADFGIGVTSTEAFTSNALPDPQTPSEQPARGWLWRDSVVGSYERASGVSATWDFPEIRFDMRSSRRVDRGVCYLNGFQGNVTNTASSWRLVGLIRVLCAT